MIGQGVVGFGLDIRRKLFSQRALRLWHSCPGKCGCPILGDAQGQVGGDPGQSVVVGAANPQQQVEMG